jgi:hypothetical protein
MTEPVLRSIILKRKVFEAVLGNIFVKVYSRVIERTRTTVRAGHAKKHG